ncbi:MAG: septation protein SpoVG family protein, partial [Tepidanaerobacteraceae bacterium]
SGKFKDIVHPINSETRAKIQDVVLSHYNDIDLGENEGTS